MRSNEAITLRWSDIDFSISPTKIHVRQEVSKTESSTRYVYISQEATNSLREWERFKYRKRDKHKKTPIKSENDMVFSVLGNRNPNGIYLTLHKEFKDVVKQIKGLEHTTFHDFRSFLKTIVSDKNYEYSVVFLGHAINSDNVYYKKKEPARKRTCGTTYYIFLITPK